MTRRACAALLALALAFAVPIAVPGAAHAAAGDLDPSFGTGGEATAPPSGTLPTTGANDLTIDGSGRIVTLGSTYDVDTDEYVFTVHRFLPLGRDRQRLRHRRPFHRPDHDRLDDQPGGRRRGAARRPDRARRPGLPDDSPQQPRQVRRRPAHLDRRPGHRLRRRGRGQRHPAAGRRTRGCPCGDPSRAPARRRRDRADPDQRRHLLRRSTGADARHHGAARPGRDVRRHLLLRRQVRPAPAHHRLGPERIRRPARREWLRARRKDHSQRRSDDRAAHDRPDLRDRDPVTGFASSLSDTPGRSTTYWQGDHTKLGEIYALAGLADGSLVAGGYQNVAASTEAAIAKYTSTGALDPSFGSGGVTLFQVGGGASLLNDLALQPDGKIVAALGGSDGNHGFVVRFTSAGTLDPTFGAGGVVATDSTSGARALTLQDDGRIVAIAPRGHPDTTLVRLLPDPPAAATEPSIRVTAPAGKRVKAKKLKAFAGTAGPTGQVTGVRIAVQRVDQALLRKDQRCLWLRNHRGTFKKVKATHKSCSRPLYRTATGTSAWTYSLRRTLDKGKYVLYAQVRLADGRTATVRKQFRVR